MHTLELEEFFNDTERPQYAILSHTWGSEEITLAEMRNSEQYRGKAGFQKIEYTCRQAANDGVEYAWVNTCCIDKTNGAELSEAINSMYRWYKESHVCYAYLQGINTNDVEDYLWEVKVGYHGGRRDTSSARLPKERWFYRGWTLQELIAPSRVEFYGAKWAYLGSSHRLLDALVAITNVSPTVLSCPLGEKSRVLKSFTIAQKMSWAAERKTTRVEDQAYCLLGIFDVNLPLLYGEGPAAFLRLQERIVERSPDQSIFAWPSSHRPSSSTPIDDGLFAPDTSFFARCGSVVSWDEGEMAEPFSLTNAGIEIRLPVIGKHEGRMDEFIVLLSCGYANDKAGAIGLRVRRTGSKQERLYVAVDDFSRGRGGNFAERTIIIDAKTASAAFASDKNSLIIQRSLFHFPWDLDDPRANLARSSLIWVSKDFCSHPDFFVQRELRFSLVDLFPVLRWKTSTLTNCSLINLKPPQDGGAVVISNDRQTLLITFGFEKQNWVREAPALWLNIHTLPVEQDFNLPLLAFEEIELNNPTTQPVIKHLFRVDQLTSRAYAQRIPDIPNGDRPTSRRVPPAEELYGFATRKWGNRRSVVVDALFGDRVTVEMIPIFAMGELRFELRCNVERLTMPSISLLRWLAPNDSRETFYQQSIEWHRYPWKVW